jgi:hypothetical protein
MVMIRRITAALILGVFINTTQAATVTYTNQAAFAAALPGVAQTLDFDSVAAGTIISSGSAVGGITFTYNFGGVEMAITDGNQFGGGGPYDTTSSPNFLGTDDADLFQDGDDFDLTFGATNAIGMYFITADIMLDNDITLTASGATASLVAADVQQTLPDFSEVFFLGVIDDTNTFSAASIGTDGGAVNFLYNVDDITTSVIPIPAAGWLFMSGIVALGWVRRRVSKQ